MKLQTFKGASSVYTVVSCEDNPQQWGVSISMSPLDQQYLIRFATRGVPDFPPKHFNARMLGGFRTDDGDTDPREGVYLDKKVVRLVSSRVPAETLNTMVQSGDVAGILAEWVLRQFELEGVEILKDFDMEVFIEGLFLSALPKLGEPGALVFKVPNNIWHELTVHTVKPGQSPTDSPDGVGEGSEGD